MNVWGRDKGFTKGSRHLLEFEKTDLKPTKIYTVSSGLLTAFGPFFSTWV